MGIRKLMLNILIISLIEYGSDIFTIIKTMNRHINTIQNIGIRTMRSMTIPIKGKTRQKKLNLLRRLQKSNATHLKQIY